jgi:LAGLIDADG DNA endonuclease family protein
MLKLLYLVLEVLVIIVPILLAVAFIIKYHIIFSKSLLNNKLFILLLLLINIFLYFYLNFNFTNNNIFIWNKENIINLSDIIFLSIIPPLWGLTKNNNKNAIINPWYVTGFTDGEGSFSFSLVKSNSNKIGWALLIHFNLVASNNPANYSMLYAIQEFFGVGQIVYSKDNSYIRYIVNGLQNCIIIRNHFLSYPLLSFKLVHFKIWSEIIDIMLAKEHLTLEGLLRIIALKEHCPNGLSNLLITEFPNYTPINCPIYNPDFTLLNIHWLAGFINADGSFGLHIQTNLLGNSNICRFRILITQHINSLVLLEAICKFLGLGKVYLGPNSIANIKIFSLNEVNKFISQFKEAKLLGSKALDYFDFCKAIELINNKSHLTKKGLDKFKQIIEGMNSFRTYFGNNKK